MMQKLFVAILIELLVYGVMYFIDRIHRQMYRRLAVVTFLVTLIVCFSAL